MTNNNKDNKIMMTIYQNTPAKNPDKIKMSLSKKKFSLIDQLLAHEPDPHDLELKDQPWNGYNRSNAGRSMHKKGGGVFPDTFQSEIMDKAKGKRK